MNRPDGDKSISFPAEASTPEYGAEEYGAEVSFSDVRK
jgi:hypothetical protein